MFVKNNFFLTFLFDRFRFLSSADRIPDLLNCIEKLLDNYLFKAAIACICTAVPLLANDGLLLNDQRQLSKIPKIFATVKSFCRF